MDGALKHPWRRDKKMKKIKNIAVTTFVLALASSAFAGAKPAVNKMDTKAEQVDKVDQRADHLKALADRAKAADLYAKAANHQNAARTHWEFANLLWNLRQDQIRKYQEESAAAANLRRQAYIFARDGQ